MSPLWQFMIGLFDAPTIALAAAIFIPLERLWPRRLGQRVLRQGWRTDLTYLLLNGAVVRLLMVGIVAALVALRPMITPESLGRLVSAQPFWVQTIELILVADLGFYLCHRVMHAVPFLWRFHSVHHSIETMDWLASFRVHPVDQIATATASLVPILLLGFSEWAVAAYVVIYRWQSILLHSNVDLRLGRLSRWIATPEFHHWHHSIDRPAWDKNFGGQLALWDVLFGTAYLPQGQRSTGFGIEDPMPDGYVDQLAQPFRQRPVRTAESATA